MQPHLSHAWYRRAYGAPLAVALWALVLTSAAHAELPKDFKDPATLLPAQTLAYGELWQPGRLIQEINGLLKGSALEDVPAAVARFRQKAGLKDDQRVHSASVGVVGVMLSPELLAEFGRVQGLASALTGFTDNGEPTSVFIILPGDSLLIGLTIRSILSVSEDVRSVGEVEGIHLYRTGNLLPGLGGAAPAPGIPPAPGQQPRPAPPRPNMATSGPIIAMAPGLIVFGSTPDSVKDVILRARGKGKGPSLADQPSFKAAARLRQGGGFFGYSDLETLVPRLDDITKKASEKDKKDAEQWQAVSKALNLKAFRSAAWSLMLRNGNVEMKALVSFDPRASNPLVELLSERKANLGLLNAVPRDSLFATVLALPDGEKRWQNLLKIADTIARMNDQKVPLPSEQSAEFEKATGVRIGKDLLGKINGLAVGAGPEGEKKGAPTGVLVIEAVDEDAARSLEALVPKLVSLAAHVGGAPATKPKGSGAPPTLPKEAIEPTSEMIQGQKVLKLPGDKLPGKSPLYYGRRGKLLVLGGTGKMVAECMISSADKKGGLLGDPKAAAAVQDLDDPILVGVWQMGKTIAYGVKELGAPVKPPVKPKGAEDPLKPKAGKGEEAPPAGKANDKFDREMTRLTGELPPVLLSLVRKPDSLTLDLRQPDLKSVSAKMIDLLVERALEQGSKEGPAGVPRPGPEPRPGPQPKVEPPLPPK